MAYYSPSNIFLQRFDSRGNRLGAEIGSIDGPTNPDNPDISAGPADVFVIAWEDHRASSSDIYAQRIDSNGNTMGNEIPVCTDTSRQAEPCIAVNSKGDFMIAWSDWRNSKTSGSDIHARAYNAGGTASGSEIVVNKNPGNQTDPSITVNTKGEFIIVWQDDSSQGDIYAGIIDPGGNNIMGIIHVCLLQSAQWEPVVAPEPDGGFVVVWRDMRSGSIWDIYCARFNADGQSLGETPVSVSASNKVEPDICVNSFGYHMVVWRDYRKDQGDIWGKWMDPNMTVLPEVKISDALGTQSNPVMTMDNRGNLFVSWEDTRTVTRVDIYARMLNFPYVPSGNVATGSLAPDNVRSWTNVSAKTDMPNASANTVTFSASTDGGSYWSAVPANGSLAQLQGAPSIRLRAQLSTSDPYTAPVLFHIQVLYTVNKLPVVSLPADLNILAKTPVNITATASDPDGDALAYSWKQTAGPDVPINETTTPNLAFVPGRSGVYAFRVTVNDGLNDSLPATLIITVNDRPSKEAPAAQFQLLIMVVVLVVIIAAAAAAVMLMRRKKPVTVIQYQPPAAQVAPQHAPPPSTQQLPQQPSAPPPPQQPPQNPPPPPFNPPQQPPPASPAQQPPAALPPQ